MKKKNTLSILVLLAALLSAALVITACSSAAQTEEMVETPPEPTETLTPLPNEVLDKIWEWRELNITDPESKTMVQNPSDYTVFFNKEGFSDVEADCNFLKGNYHLVGNTLGFSVIEPNLQICAPESASCTFLILMGQVDTYRMEDGKLVLPFGDGAGEMVFYQVGAMNIPPADLDDYKPTQEGPTQESPGEEGPGEEGPGDDGSKKAIVCHKIEGKNPVTLEISKNALQAHLNHGDSEGPCP